ncbi:hypothetical protein ASF10_17435, partial [Flavobacterium sp. Leaf82]
WWSICSGIRWSVCSGTGGQFSPELGGQIDRFFHYKSRRAFFEERRKMLCALLWMCPIPCFTFFLFRSFICLCAMYRIMIKYYNKQQEGFSVIFKF